MKPQKGLNGRRWTPEMRADLITLWNQGMDLAEIGQRIGATRLSCLKMVQRMRKDGAPLPHRAAGNYAGRKIKRWTEEDIGELIELRNQGVVVEELCGKFGVSPSAIFGKLNALYNEGRNVARFGTGPQRGRKRQEAESLWLPIFCLDQSKMQLCLVAEDGAVRLRLWMPPPLGLWRDPETLTTPRLNEACQEPTHFMICPAAP